jgi:peptide/nickel transport system substrate-binding protein
MFRSKEISALHHNRRLALIVGSLVCSALIVSALAAGATGSHRAASDTLIIADQATPVALDPTLYSGEPMIESVYNVYATLLRYKPTTIAPGVRGDNIHATAEQGLEGWLATSWKRVGDRKLRFALRQGVESPYGNELTSADVVYTVKRNLGLKLVGAQSLHQGRIIGAAAVDKYTVDITTSVYSTVAPFIAALPLALGVYDSTEVKKHATADDPWARDWLKLHTAGFGPYTLGSAVPGEQFTFTANANYFEAAPGFKNVIWREVDSASTRVALLQANQIDIAATITPQLRLGLRGKANVQVLDVGKRWSMLSIGLTLNTLRKPFDDWRVRQAMAYLIPYNDILTKVYRGEATIRKGSVAPGLDGGTEANWHFATNISKAKALLAQAGYPNGFSTSLSFDSSQATLEPIASLVRDGLAKGGVQVQLNKQSAAVYSDTTMVKRNFDSHLTYGGPLIPNAAYELDLWYDHKNFIDTGGYYNPKAEKFILGSVTARTHAGYVAAVAAADKIIMHDQPRVGVVNDGDHYQFSKRLKGFYWRANTNHYDWYHFRP